MKERIIAALAAIACVLASVSPAMADHLGKYNCTIKHVAGFISGPNMERYSGAIVLPENRMTFSIVVQPHELPTFCKEALDTLRDDFDNKIPFKDNDYSHLDRGAFSSSCLMKNDLVMKRNGLETSFGAFESDFNFHAWFGSDWFDLFDGGAFTMNENLPELNAVEDGICVKIGTAP